MTMTPVRPGRPLTWLTATICVAAACETSRAVEETPPVEVAVVSVSPAAAAIEAGTNVQLTASVRSSTDSVLTDREVAWLSLASSVAGVSSTGLVTAGAAAGQATITATSEGKSGTATITVTVTPPPVASVSVAPATASVDTGKTLQLTVTVKDAAGNVLVGRTVAWSSSHPGRASVSGSGLVTGGTNTGQATITATSEGKSGTSTITVNAPAPPPPPPPAAVAVVQVSPPSVTIDSGSTVQLQAILRDANNNVLTGRTISWTSSNTAVATVTQAGLVGGARGGSATITATSEGKSGNAAVSVSSIRGQLVTDPSLVFDAPPVPKPAYNAPVTVAPFGTQIRRISHNPNQSMQLAVGSGTWGTMVRNNYTKDQSWNSDGSMLLLQNDAAPYQFIVDGATYAPLRPNCSQYQSREQRWHPSRQRPSIRIHVTGSALIWYDVTTCAEVRRWSLPSPASGFGLGEGNPSFDGRYVALGDQRRAYVVDMESYPTPRIGPVYDLSDCGLASGCSIDWISITPSGKYVVVAYGYDLLRVFDLNPTTLALTPRPMATTYPRCKGAPAKGFIYNIGHGDMTLNPFDNMEDVLVGEESCENIGTTVNGVLVGGVVMVRIRDGLMSSLTTPGNEAVPVHVSARNFDRLGWVYVSYYPYASFPSFGRRFQDEIVAMRLDGRAVERLAHQRSLYDPNSSSDLDYFSHPMPIPSPDGLRVLWGSNWSTNCGSGCGTQSVIQAYIVDTRGLR